MGSLSSSFIPAGRLRNPPFPSRFIVSDRSSPSRVRFAASRPGMLRADPKGRLFMREKGGCRSASDFVSHLIAFDSIAPQTRAFGPCGRAESFLSAHSPHNLNDNILYHARSTPSPAAPRQAIMPDRSLPCSRAGDHPPVISSCSTPSLLTERTKRESLTDSPCGTFSHCCRNRTKQVQ